MDNYSGWEKYYNDNNANSIWKEDIESFLTDNEEAIIPSKQRLNVLDVACGDGRNTAFFYNKGSSICCVDISGTALKKLDRKFPFATKLCCDIMNAPLSPNQFDVVMCFDGLPQMENPVLALNRMIQFTKVGGLIVFNFFTPEDCAYGEGEKIDESTFNFKNTLFKFYTFEQAKAMIPSSAKIIKAELRHWSDPL